MGKGGGWVARGTHFVEPYSWSYSNQWGKEGSYGPFSVNQGGKGKRQWGVVEGQKDFPVGWELPSEAWALVRSYWGDVTCVSPVSL